MLGGTSGPPFCPWHWVPLASPPSTRDRDHLESLVPETNTDVETVPAPEAVEEDLVEESLVEEVSIDGMCGVY